MKISIFITITDLATNSIESISAPQFGSPIGTQIGDINNNGTNVGGGGASLQPYGELSNRTDSVPGSGYAGEYYSHHANETAPTSPSFSSGQINIQDSSLPTSSCDCNQIGNVQEMVPTDAAPPNAPSDLPAENAVPAEAPNAKK